MSVKTLDRPSSHLDKDLLTRHFVIEKNTEMYYVLVADPPQNTGPLRTVDMRQQPMTHEFGSSIPSLTLRMGDVPYLAPQCPTSYGAGPSNPGYFQENVYMSDNDPNFRSSQYLVDPQTRDATMTKTGRSVITREAGYGGSVAFNPGSYSYFVDLSAVTGDASINSLSSDATDPTNLNEGYLEDVLNFYFKTPSAEIDGASCRNGGQELGIHKYEKTLLW